MLKSFSTTIISAKTSSPQSMLKSPAMFLISKRKLKFYQNNLKYSVAEKPNLFLCNLPKTNTLVIKNRK